MDLLDEQIPVVPGCEIHDDPLAPLCSACRARVAREGDAMPIAWLPREARYVEKLATPDVTIADMVGDIDPIKAAQAGLNLSDELTMHYGLLPRANRGIFAINELPDLAGKIQVGLFNILQEGDVQIKGYPIRLKLDVMLVFTANPKTTRRAARSSRRSRTASGLKSARIIRPRATTRWPSPGRRRGPSAPTASVSRSPTTSVKSSKRSPSRRAPIARSTSDRASASACRSRRSSSSCRTPNGVRCPTANRSSCRVTDLAAALPSITGKFELEYEGELRGAEQVARDLIRAAVGAVFTGMFEGQDTRTVVEWFDPRRLAAPERCLVRGGGRHPITRRQGLRELAERAGLAPGAPAPVVASAIDFVLEGLYAQKKISRSEERGYSATEPQPRRTTRREEPTLDEGFQVPGGKKKYYN